MTDRHACWARTEFIVGDRKITAICSRFLGHATQAKNQPLKHYDNRRKYSWYEDFFQQGHTYETTNPRITWRFRCDVVTTHPGTGELVALGWLFFAGEWKIHTCSQNDWATTSLKEENG